MSHLFIELGKKPIIIFFFFLTDPTSVLDHVGIHVKRDKILKDRVGFLGLHEFQLGRSIAIG